MVRTYTRVPLGSLNLSSSYINAGGEIVDTTRSNKLQPVYIRVADDDLDAGIFELCKKLGGKSGEFSAPRVRVTA